MAPSKRSKTSAAPEQTSGNATQGSRTRRSASARSDLPDAPDADLADLDAELPEPAKDDGTRSCDDEGDVGVLRTWRTMCPELQERWPEAVRPEHWDGVTMENGRVVELELVDFGLTGGVPAEVGRMSALRELHLRDNQLTSVPA